MIVLDSHIWFWWVSGQSDRFGADVRDVIETAPRVGVSPVSCYELAWAHRRNRLELPVAPKDWFPPALGGSGIELLVMSERIATTAACLSEIHSDPFDRIIIATALATGARLASVDSVFRHYPELENVLL